MALGAWGALATIFAVGVLGLPVDTTTASFLDRNGPEWAAYQRSLQRHGGDEFIAIAVPTDSMSEREAFAVVETLSKQLLSFPGVRRVDSLSTIGSIRSDKGVVRLDPLLGDRSSADLGRMRTAVADNPLLSGVASADGKVLGINVLLDEDVDAPRDELVDQIRGLVANAGARFTGVPVFRTEINSRTSKEILKFVPLTIALIAILLAIATASVPGVLIPLSVAGMGALASLGVMGATGATLSLSTMILPSTLLALGCAYSFHCVSAVAGCLRADDVANAAADVAGPIVLSGATTAIGFLAMSTLRIQAIRDLAVFGAVGVLVIAAASVTLAPALAALFPVGPLSAFATRGAALFRERLLLGALTWRVRTLVLWSIAVAGIAVGSSQLRISTDVINWFPRGSAAREDYERIRRDLGGITPVNVLVESTDGRSLLRREGLAFVEGLAAMLRGVSQVGQVTTIADPIGRLHRFYSEPEGRSKLPNEEQVEQYLLLLSGDRYISDLVSSDRLSTSVVLRLDENSSDRIVQVRELVSEWASERSADIQVSTTGVMYEFARSEEEIAVGQLRGLGLAALAIGSLLWIVSRDARLAGGVALVGLVPVSAAFGLMGALAIPLDAATVCLGSLALGIAVDDSIHLVSRYWDARSSGRSRAVALAQSLDHVLLPISVTTAAIVLGFGALGFSDFTLIRNLGLVTAFVVFLCLVADCTLLPVLLQAIGPRASSRRAG